MRRTSSFGKIDVPVVTTIHSDYLLDFDTFYKKLIFERLNRSALKKINYKIAVSDAFRDMLVERGFMPNDVLTVYNGMDFTVPVSPVSREKFAADHGIPFDPGTVYVGIAARFDYVKGVDVFIRAAAELVKKRDDLRFVIAGEGDEGDKLRALAKQLGAADRIHFIGFIDPIYDFLNFIDINTLTSRSESFPYSILEGARMSKPTVAAAVGGIPKLILEGETGFVFPSDDHAACAEKIAALADSSELRETLGDNLYGKATSEYSNVALADKYLENYAAFIRKFRREKRYDVILSGYYGFGNFGDEIILSTIVRKIREERPEGEILILSKNPLQTEKKFGAESISRYNYRKIRRAMDDAYCYINGGGTLFTDVTSTHSLAYYAGLMKMAVSAGLRTMLLANGVGPFRRRSNEKRALKVLSRVDVMTLRDRGAYEFIKEKLPSSRTYLASDIIFAYCNADLRDRLISRRAVLPGGLTGKYFIVSLREFELCGDRFKNAVAEVCVRVCRERGLNAVFMPMQYGKDLAICGEVASAVRAAGVDGVCVIPEDHPGDKVELMAQAEFMLGMRLHALMLAAALSVPVAALSYDIKIENFINENRIGPCFDVANVDPDLLYSAINEMIRGSADGESYNAFISEMSRRSEVNVTRLLELIDG